MACFVSIGFEASASFAPKLPKAGLGFSSFGISAKGCSYVFAPNVDASVLDLPKIPGGFFSTNGAEGLGAAFIFSC